LKLLGLLGGGVMKRYPIDKLYEEMEFIAYYNHWDYETLMNMEHRERAKWCQQISKINQNINGEKEKKNIFDNILFQNQHQNFL